LSITHAGLALVCLSLLLCPQGQAEGLIAVTVKPLAQLEIYPESAAPAAVVSLNDASITAQIDAQLTEMAVRVGDAVKAGQVLAQLACQDFELERTRLQGERQASQARLELAGWQLQQTETLAAQQTVPQEQVQEKRAQLSVLRGELAANAARIDTTTRQIGHCSVKAPFSGVVTARLIGIGQFVTRSTPLLRLLDTGHCEVSAQVPTREVAALTQAKTLTFEYNSQHYPLRLRTIVPTIRPETGSQEVRLDFSGRKAEPGAAGRLVWRNPAPHLAAEALLKRGEQWGVFTASAGMAHFQPLPDAQPGHPALIALPPDTPIVVSGQYGLNDGMPVTVQTDTPPKADSKGQP